MDTLCVELRSAESRGLVKIPEGCVPRIRRLEGVTTSILGIDQKATILYGENLCFKRC